MQQTQQINLLPKDGTVNYYGKILSDGQADLLLQELLEQVNWQHDQAKIFGRLIETKRKVAWYGDEAYSYTYSGITKTASPWISPILQLKTLTEAISGEKFNSCLLNLYHDGSEGMAWHSDGEKDLKKNGAIASLSLGAERRFLFKHKTEKSRITLMLEHGSLLIMKDTTQQHWLHRLPPTKQIFGARVNLTFRTIVRQH